MSNFSEILEKIQNLEKFGILFWKKFKRKWNFGNIWENFWWVYYNYETHSSKQRNKHDYIYFVQKYNKQRPLVAKLFVLMAPLRLDQIGGYVSWHHPLALGQHSALSRFPVGFRIWPESFGQGCRPRPQAGIHRVAVGLLRPQCGLASQNLRLQIFTCQVVHSRHVVDNLLRTVHVDLLPADVRRAPVVAFADPRSKSEKEFNKIMVLTEKFQNSKTKSCFWLRQNRIFVVGPVALSAWNSLYCVLTFTKCWWKY